ncbi:hypothetical protein [Klebsiella pneumoniae]|uniref:hypothetical protein n=1 Tax=Klebsiella pneumoniae TaxID=573 RepID=UPI0022B6BC1D|nr:hypothetical protein [Klebsiella pneumoniae]
MAVLAQIVFASMLGKAGSNKLIDFLHGVSIISASVATILIKRFQPLGSQLADLFTIPYPANPTRRVLIASDNFTLLENDEHGLIGNAVVLRPDKLTDCVKLRGSFTVRDSSSAMR